MITQEIFQNAAVTTFLVSVVGFFLRRELVRVEKRFEIWEQGQKELLSLLTSYKVHDIRIDAAEKDLSTLFREFKDFDKNLNAAINAVQNLQNRLLAVPTTETCLLKSNSTDEKMRREIEQLRLKLEAIINQEIDSLDGRISKELEQIKSKINDQQHRMDDHNNKRHSYG